MKNNERNSRKRLNSLILLVAFTAVMLIVSTYAWFSTQKNVTLDGLKGVVNVAEGLQISLDAEHWVNTINFEDFNQPTDGTGWTVKDTATSTYLNSGMTFQSPRGSSGGITNVTPKEFFPVSTTGYDSTADGIGESAIKFYQGTNTETIKLMGDTGVVTESGTAGYFAFDLFLQNTSAGTANDVLQLDPISDVTGNVETTGVQNTARVGLALYENAGDSMNVSTVTSATYAGSTAAEKAAAQAAAIVAGTSTGKTISDFAIWEPNADNHAASIVSSLANSLKLDATEHAKWSGLGTINSNTGISTFSDGVKLPTYALTSLSIVGADGNKEKVHIADVYDWRVSRTDDESTTGVDESKIAALGVKKQFTLQTTGYDTSSADYLRSAPVNFVSTKKLETNAAATDTTFEIKPSQYQKIRVYIWMEGQDPDCINAASLGGGLTIDLGFSKPGQDGSSSAS